MIHSQASITKQSRQLLVHHESETLPVPSTAALQSEASLRKQTAGRRVAAWRAVHAPVAQLALLAGPETTSVQMCPLSYHHRRKRIFKKAHRKLHGDGACWELLENV